MDVLINLILVIIPQCTCISNLPVVHFEHIQFCQLFLSKAGKIIKKKKLIKFLWDYG